MMKPTLQHGRSPMSSAEKEPVSPEFHFAILCGFVSSRETLLNDLISR
jgi:hypothetical protein